MTTRYRITIDIEVDRVTRADLNDIALGFATKDLPYALDQAGAKKVELKYVATERLTDDRDVLAGSR